MAKLGRPTLAAQTLDEALARHYRGESPKRPRNQYERQAMLKQTGRTSDAQCPTSQAAVYAAYLVKFDSKTLTAASKLAGLAYKVDAANIRRYAKRIIDGPKSLLTQRSAQWFGHAPPVETPLLASVEDVVLPNVLTVFQ